ncbi:RNA 2',3'-cyclic phosphodiesterase [Candidatus Falkowbacteria bacterium]|nr:RNA 2',3'-cyclic phosphodiesterase [Candidatus Falkowbacteria bacterium]
MSRVFIALPVPKRIEQRLIDIQKNIKVSERASIKWVEEGNFHITLEFLGEIGDQEIERAKEALKMIVDNYPRFELSLVKVDAFPSLKKAGVLVVKVDDAEGVGLQLRQDIHKQLKELGLSDNGRRWKPHLTLGRAKKLLKLSQLSEMGIEDTSWMVKELVLYESFLTRSGPIYKVLAKYDLNKK